MIRYTQEEKAFLIEYIPGRIASEVVEEFIKKFGKTISISQIRSFRKNNKINCGRDTRFKKGSVPANKGKRLSPEVYEKLSKTMFKKRQIPKNYRPVGSVRINVDGYIEIKVKDPNKWKLKHRVVWEESNGKIPAGMNLIFRDNNPLNTKLDNLMLVTRAENMEMNNIGAGACKNIEKEILLNSIRLKNAVKNKLSRAKE